MKTAIKPQPFNSDPDIKAPHLKNLFRWVREHHGWRKYKRGVTWDFRCEECGFTIENVPTRGCDGFMAVKDDRKIVQRVSNLRDYNPVLCTVCAPLPKNSESANQ